jgi:hypothetical protein
LRCVLEKSPFHGSETRDLEGRQVEKKGDIWTAVFFETAAKLDTYRRMKFVRRKNLDCCKIAVAGKAEASSAGEQLAKEYPAGNSCR